MTYASAKTTLRGSMPFRRGSVVTSNRISPREAGRPPRMEEPEESYDQLRSLVGPHLKPDLDLVATILGLLGRCVVGRAQRLVRPHANGVDLARRDTPVDQLLHDHLRALRGQLLVVIGLAARVGVPRNLELVGLH